MIIKANRLKIISNKVTRKMKLSKKVNSSEKLCTKYFWTDIQTNKIITKFQGCH